MGDMTVYFVTGSENKFKEVAEILKPVEVKQLKFGIDEIQNWDVKKVAEEKAKTAYNKNKKPVIVEDTSFEIPALKNFPGPFIKWSHSSIGNKGLLKLMNSAENREAKAIVCVCFYNGQDMKTFVGELKGRIAEKETNHGWAFDSIFIPDGQDKTIAELGMEWKNKNSHRFKAFLELKKFLTK